MLRKHNRQSDSRSAVAKGHTAVASGLAMTAAAVEIEVAGLCFMAVQLLLCALGNDEGVLVLDSLAGHIEILVIRWFRSIDVYVIVVFLQHLGMANVPVHFPHFNTCLRHHWILVLA